ARATPLRSRASRALASAPAHGIRVGSWKTKPIPGRPPSKATVPALGRSSPAIRRSAVDLPQPDGPTSDTNSPAATSRSSGEIACTPLSKVFETPERERISIVMARECGPPRWGRSTAESLVQILPFDIVRLNEVHLPFALIFFQPLLPGDGGMDVLE